MATVFINGVTEINMMDNLKIVLNMAKEKKFLQTVTSTLENMSMGNLKDKASTNGLMATFIKDSSKMA